MPLSPPCKTTDDLSEFDAELLDVLRTRGPLDRELIAEGYFPHYSRESVSNGLQRLKRRGLITNAPDRRWWEATS